MKVGIIGAGAVGSTAAYAIMMMGAATDVVLVDINEKFAGAQAEDIMDATPLLHPLRVYGGDYAALKGADIVVLCASPPPVKFKDRLELLAGSAAILKNMVPQVAAHAPGAIIIVATNPVDIIVDLTRELGDSQFYVTSCQGYQAENFPSLKKSFPCGSKQQKELRRMHETGG